MTYAMSFPIGEHTWVKPEIRLEGIVGPGESYETAYFRVFREARSIWAKAAIEKSLEAQRRLQYVTTDPPNGIGRWLMEIIQSGTILRTDNSPESDSPGH